MESKPLRRIPCAAPRPGPSLTVPGVISASLPGWPCSPAIPHQRFSAGKRAPNAAPTGVSCLHFHPVCWKPQSLLLQYFAENERQMDSSWNMQLHSLVTQGRDGMSVFLRNFVFSLSNFYVTVTRMCVGAQSLQSAGAGL